jgi:hypothetical protein
MITGETRCTMKLAVIALAVFFAGNSCGLLLSKNDEGEISITPPHASISINQQLRLEAILISSSGGSQDITTSAVWTTSNTDVLAVIGSGLVEPRKEGTAAISARRGNLFSNAIITIFYETPTMDPTAEPTTAPTADPTEVPTAVPTGSQTFSAIGSMQTFIVPAGIFFIAVDATGAQGAGTNNTAGCNNGHYPPYGMGARVQATIPVIPGELLYIFVGTKSGFNGGGAFHGTIGSGGNGGGASDIRQGGSVLVNRIIVAGGGGGGADGINGIGGWGGSEGLDGIDPNIRNRGTGGNASGVGDPGTQTSGGAGGFCGLEYGGTYGSNGTLGQGGDGGIAGTSYPYSNGGGGGGGYFGGGGGGAGIDGGGGGGGSCLVPVGGIMTPGFRVGDGLVIINW